MITQNERFTGYDAGSALINARRFDDQFRHRHRTPEVDGGGSPRTVVQLILRVDTPELFIEHIPFIL